MSAAPAATSASSATQSDGANPNATIATPQLAAAKAIARPWWRTDRVQPLVTVASSEPTEGAVYSSPRTAGPPSPDAICGKSAIGMPKNIALMSTRYEPSRSWRPAA